jgi:hypothetical protein
MRSGSNASELLLRYGTAWVPDVGRVPSDLLHVAPTREADTKVASLLWPD